MISEQHPLSEANLCCTINTLLYATVFYAPTVVISIIVRKQEEEEANIECNALKSKERTPAHGKLNSTKALRCLTSRRTV